jgi:hypothetical protein
MSYSKKLINPEVVVVGTPMYSWSIRRPRVLDLPLGLRVGAILATELQVDAVRMEID